MHFMPRVAAFFITVLALPLAADEGMWQPHQLPSLTAELKASGFAGDAATLADLNAFPMNAIVSLGGCSASFVSPQGLVITNHHCVYGSVQYASSESANYLRDGFYAASLADEVPAAPGTRVFVTEAVTEVTSQVLADIPADADGLQRYQRIEANIKQLIETCEADGRHRCEVPAFHFGLSYFLVKKLEIKDVRLVYAPADSIGRYGGDIDNWMWPRHTGDFGFYRAYVAPDGSPREYHKDNVPYGSPSHLKVAPAGVQEGDFVMAAGYPGRTNRYRLASEVALQFEQSYPYQLQLRNGLMAIIDELAHEGSPERLLYANDYARLSNYAKNFESMLRSYRSGDLLARKRAQEADFAQFAQSRPQGNKALPELDQLVADKAKTLDRDTLLAYLDAYTQMPAAANLLYRYALEQQKPDAEREPGYQARDLPQIEETLRRMTRRYDPEVDAALFNFLLRHFAELPAAQRIPELDEFVRKNFKRDKDGRYKLDKLYRATELDDEATRLSWLERSPEQFQQSRDPFMRLAVALMPARQATEADAKRADGDIQRARAMLMADWIAWRSANGEVIYADANSTLRVTFGEVGGNRPRDGLINLPFTTLEGLLEKYTGETPFDMPARQRELIQAKQYGPYKLESLGSVPVNFLCDLDITGGNSGSAVMNENSELVGLLFDGVYESIIGDWDFNEEKNRAIAVDVRYMLWVMRYVDNAARLLAEMQVPGGD